MPRVRIVPTELKKKPMARQDSLPPDNLLDEYDFISVIYKQPIQEFVEQLTGRQ